MSFLLIGIFNSEGMQGTMFIVLDELQEQAKEDFL